MTSFYKTETPSLVSAVEVFGQIPKRTGYREIVLGLYWIYGSPRGDYEVEYLLGS
jgi:hypothetical protein